MIISNKHTLRTGMIVSIDKDGKLFPYGSYNIRERLIRWAGRQLQKLANSIASYHQHVPYGIYDDPILRNQDPYEYLREIGPKDWK